MNSVEPQTSEFVGTLIAGKYRVHGVLGSGGMGVVLAATHSELGCEVAVKIMRGELSEHPEAVERLLREARLAAQFRGDHICRVLDVGLAADGRPFIVMEYLEGSDLAAVLTQHGTLDIETAVDLMLEAGEALAEAHSANIVHRDLKPENLFVARRLDGSPILKVLDFGISKQVGSFEGRALTNPTATLGSPHYMAPEQMRSARDVDQRSDLWALGAILYELLSGRQAFIGESLTSVCSAVLSDSPVPVSELRPEVPIELSAVVARCLQKDRDLRFDSISELAAALVPFGSAASEASFERIGRVIERTSSPSSRPSSRPPAHPSLGRYAPPSSRGLSAGAGHITPSSETRSATWVDNPRPPRRAHWIAPVFGLFVLLAGALCLALGSNKQDSKASEETALSAARNRTVLSVQASGGRLASGSAGPVAAPGTAPSPRTSAQAEPTPTPTPAAATVAGTSPRAKRVQALAQLARGGVGRPAPIPTAIVPASAVASPAPATPAPATKKAPDAAAAWDPNSFGPRN